MADLQIAPPRPRSVLPAILIAILVLAAVAWAVFRFNPDHVADLKVTRVQTFAPHTEFKALETTAKTHSNMRVLSKTTAATGEDDLYVVVNASVTDRLRLPLFLEGTQIHVTLADGEQIMPRIIFGDTLKRLEGIFPALAPIVGTPLALDDQVDPGATRTGSVVLLMPGTTPDTWAKKRSASLTLLLRNQGPQTAKLP